MATLTALPHDAQCTAALHAAVLVGPRPGNEARERIAAVGARLAGDVVIDAMDARAGRADDGEHGSGRLGFGRDADQFGRHWLSLSHQGRDDAIPEPVRQVLGPLRDGGRRDADGVSHRDNSAAEQFERAGFLHSARMLACLPSDCKPAYQRVRCNSAYMSTPKDRIQELMRETHLKSTMQIAKAARVSSSAVSQWLGKGSKDIQSIGTTAAVNLEAATGYCARWIAKGEGPKQRPEAAPPAAPVRQVTESQWAMLQDFEILPEDEKAALRTTLRANADRVRRIVAEYLGRQGVASPPASNARVEEAFGPPPPRPPDPEHSAISSYQKVTPIPGAPEPGAHKKGSR